MEFLDRQTLEYFGKTNEESKDWALIEVVHPEDLPRVVEAHKKSKRDRSTMLSAVVDADGVYRWFQVRGVPVRDTENKTTTGFRLNPGAQNADRHISGNSNGNFALVATLPIRIRPSSANGYQVIGDTFVQLFRRHASGLIAWDAARWLECIQPLSNTGRVSEHS